jgi:bla regulator protein blaR1
MFARTFMLGATVALFAVGAQASPPAGGAELSHSATRDAFVLLSAGSENIEMSGSMDDVRRARSLRADGQALLYVRQGGSAYVIRDAATLRKAKSLFEPQETLGRRQAELGSRQAALGREQASLGGRQAALSYRQVGDSPREAEDRAHRQVALSEQQARLGTQQAALGHEQQELGRQQSDLGRAADKQMQILFAEALASGLAQRVD